MNKRFSGTQDLTQSVQRQVNILIDRKDAYNMQILQDWSTFRWSRNTLCWVIQHQHWSRWQFTCSQMLHCVGVSNPDPSNNWTTKLEDVWNEHGFVENWSWQLQRRNSFGTHHQALPHLTSRNKFRHNRMGWMQKIVGTMTKRWQHLRHNSSPDTGASWSLRQRRRGGTGISTNRKDNGTV